LLELYWCWKDKGKRIKVKGGKQRQETRGKRQARKQIKDKGKKIKVGGAVEPEGFRNNLQVNIRYLCGR